MRSHFLEVRNSIQGTTGQNWLKFCMGPPRGVIWGIVEGFLEIRSGGPDMGYPWGLRGGPNFLKNFFSIFSFFSAGMDFWRSKSLIKVKTNPSFDHFESFGCSERGRVYFCIESNNLFFFFAKSWNFFDGVSSNWVFEESNPAIWSKLYKSEIFMLRRGQVITKPYGSSIFQIHFFAFLISDSDFSWKSICTNYFYFFNIPTGTWSKLRKTAISPTFLNLPQFFTVFSIFDNVPIRILKK